jgi:hypothetical protein
MSKDLSRTTRRALLTAGGVAAAAGAAAVVATPAEAATGSALILGRPNAQSTTTTVTSTTTGVAMQVNAVGAAASFQSSGSNGFAGGTTHKDHYGLSCSNKGTTAGAGAALAASGLRNTAIVANTDNAAKYVLDASNRGATAATPAGAVSAYGGIGDGVVAASAGDPTGFSGVTAFHLLKGGAAIYGAGSIGVYCVSQDKDGGFALWAQSSDGAEAINAVGNVRVTGDLFVDGTIHTSAASVDTGWVPTAAAARRVARRAVRTSSRLRAAQ